MDTAMRDLEQIQEHHPEEGGRRFGMLALAGVMTVGLVFAMGSMLQASAEEPVQAEDPLAALDRIAGLEASEDVGEAPAPIELDTRSLQFHDSLTATPTRAAEAAPTLDDRPEVVAALAQAAAELAHPSAPGDAPLGSLALASTRRPSEALAAQAVVHTVPAAVAATPAGDALTRTVQEDPMVAAALPGVAEQREVREPATEGEDGRYTLQVISYTTQQEADVFAEALRARGHHAFVMEAFVESRDRTYFRVRVGPFSNMGQANRYRATFEREEQMNTFVVRRRDNAPSQG